MKPPSLLPFSDYDGDWGRYEDALYAVFQRDILRNKLIFRGQRVSARRAPEYARKWACFWHLISEGNVEDDRTPNLRRCENLPLIRWVIENADAASEIDVWLQVRNSKKNWMLWYDEYYLVVLSQRSGYHLLTTAFCTERQHQVIKKRKERDKANAQN